MLDYTITPNAVPRTVSPTEPSVVTLMITVTNRTGAEVPVQRLTFTIQAGDGPANLTDAEHLSEIRPAAGSGTPWEIFPASDGQFFAYPSPPHAGLAPGESIAFVLSRVTVNSAIGNAQIGVRESAAEPHSTTLTVAKQEPGLAITELLASPVQITPGQTSALAWRTTGASKCTMTTERSSQPVDRLGSMQVSPQETTVYTLSAEGGGRTIHQQVIVTVATVKVLSFSATPRYLAKGEETTFAWKTAGAASCTLDPGGITLEPPAAGKLALPVEVSGFYTLIASGHGRHDPRSVPVTVMPVELTRFGAAPLMVAAGGEVTLSWDARWASGFYLEPPGQALDRGTSSVTVRPTRPTTYRLTARGLDERTAEVTVSAGPAIAAIGLTTNPGNPRVMMLAWEVVHGTAQLTVGRAGTPRPVPPAGNEVISLPTLVTLTATGGGVTTSATLRPSALVMGWEMLQSLRLAGPTGIGAERSTVTTSWQAQSRYPNSVGGWIWDEHDSRMLPTLSGQAELRLGPRAAGRPLWQGYIRVGVENPEIEVEWTIS